MESLSRQGLNALERINVVITQQFCHLSAGSLSVTVQEAPPSDQVLLFFVRRL